MHLLEAAGRAAHDVCKNQDGAALASPRELAVDRPPGGGGGRGRLMAHEREDEEVGTPQSPCHRLGAALEAVGVSDVAEAKVDGGAARSKVALQRRSVRLPLRLIVEQRDVQRRVVAVVGRWHVSGRRLGRGRAAAAAGLAQHTRQLHRRRRVCGIGARRSLSRRLRSCRRVLSVRFGLGTRRVAHRRSRRRRRRGPGCRGARALLVRVPALARGGRRLARCRHRRTRRSHRCTT